MVNVDLPYVIAVNWRARQRLPAGKAEQVRPRRRLSEEEAHWPPPESEVLCGN